MVPAILIGALDGALVVALPVAVLALVALVAWAGLGTPTDWTAFVRGAAIAWLLGHGVDVRFTVGGTAFPVTIALLGPALVTALCAVRSGRRAAGTGSPRAAWLAGVLITGVAGGVLVAVAGSAVAAPSVWQGVVLPAALVAAASGPAALRRPAPLGAGLRSGLGAVAIVLAASAVAVALTLAVHLADVVGLYEALAAGAGGGFALTAAQVLLVPTAVVWAAAWFTGAGFLLGTGSVVGPFGTAVGPLPALPLLGAVPAHPPALAAAGLLVPVLAGFAAGLLAARRGTVRPVRLGAVTGAVAGLLLGALAAAGAGAAGPGRFATVGPDPLLVGLLAAVEVGLPAIIGAAAGRARPALRAAPSEAPEPAH